MSWRGILIGGPRDGIEIGGSTPGPPWTINTTVPVEITPIEIMTPPDAMTCPPIAMYNLVISDGRKSIDDDGRYRYRYGGTI